MDPIKKLLTEYKNKFKSSQTSDLDKFFEEVKTEDNKDLFIQNNYEVLRQSVLLPDYSSDFFKFDLDFKQRIKKIQIFVRHFQNFDHEWPLREAVRIQYWPLISVVLENTTTPHILSTIEFFKSNSHLLKENVVQNKDFEIFDLFSTPNIILEKLSICYEQRILNELSVNLKTLSENTTNTQQMATISKI